jgi:hypothetical protein
MRYLTLEVQQSCDDLASVQESTQAALVLVQQARWNLEEG